MSDKAKADPFGDKDPLILEALRELRYALEGEVGGGNFIVSAIDDLIQARIVIALETLINASFPKPNDHKE
jgi:hypothetical protein